MQGASSRRTSSPTAGRHPRGPRSDRFGKPGGRGPPFEERHDPEQQAVAEPKDQETKLIGGDGPLRQPPLLGDKKAGEIILGEPEFSAAAWRPAVAAPNPLVLYAYPLDSPTSTLDDYRLLAHASEGV